MRVVSDVSHLQVERGLGGLHEHPRIEDLEPDGGTLEEKWRLNEFGVGAGRSKLFLRTAMINHACDPNAGHHVFEGFKVAHPKLFDEQLGSAVGAIDYVRGSGH